MKRISINILFLILSGGLASAQSFVSPIDNRQVTQPYANYGFVPGKYHTGMDINRQGIDPYSQRTEKVKAARAGTVHKIFGLYITGNNLRRWNPSTGTYTWEPAPPGDNHGLGICVIIYHPDLKLYTLYGHLDAVVTGLNVGNNVSAGQVIGLLGNSYKQFLRRCRNDDGHDHQALCVNTAPDAPLGTITKDSDGFRPHVHFETKDRGVLSTRRTDDEGPDWGYTPGPAPSTPNMPGHPNWFGYHDPNIFLNLSVQMLTEPVPIEILQSPLNVRSYPSTSPPSDSLNYVITSISQRSDGNLPAFVTMRSVGSQWYQIYLPNAETEGWSASGWIAGTLDSTYSKTNATLPQVKVIKDSAWVRTQPQSGSQTLALVYGENQQDPQRFVPFDTTTGWYRIYLPVKSPQPDGWISSSDVQFIGTATRTLTVASANPNSGVSITVSPNDNNGQGNGTTQFTRTYNNNTSVTLTAPSTAQSNTFQKWQRNGVDYVPSQSITVTMDADYTLTAVYVTPTVTRTLTVASSNPNSGVSITVSPNDNNGQGNGTTQFTRVYNNNAVVTLTAPSTAQSNTFQKWQRNGADFSINQSINVTMDANYTLTAVYVTPTVTRTLTVASSNPNSGVSITVSPNDNNGQGNGTTQFTRVYNNNTSVTLTAPSTAQNNTFQKWQHNGVDFSTNPSISVTMDANYTLTAVYVTQPTQLPPSIFASFHSDVTPNSATLNGNVNPNGLSTTAWFEWGPTPAYGNATPSSDLGTGTSIVSYNQTLSGLSPNTTYYYRAVAQNSFGTSKEVQRTFTTATPSDSFTEIPTGLIGAYNSSVAWGDYDNDGDLDILLTGWPNGPDVSKVYRNDNGNFVDISASLIGVEMSSVAWGDYDNDGDLDILLTGAPQSGDYISKIYRNDNGNFVDISVSLTGVAQGSVAWGDYDNDGDLDILLTGHSGSDWISKIYRNNVGTANTVPTPPTNLTSSVSGNSVTLSWNKSTDLETFQNGLTYNLGVGTTSGGAQIVSPMASAATGYRKVPQLGNTNHRNSWTIKNLPDGTYYWSVQAIDSAFAGSAFAAERSFVIQRTAPDIAVTPTPGDYGNVTVGATSDKTFTVSNPGTATLNVTSTTLTGTDASQFSIQSGGGSFSLNPGQTRNIVVRFAPTSTGNKSATLSLANNVTGKNPFNVSLSGMGTDISPVPIFPTSVNAGIVNKGVSSTATFTVKNTGGGTLSVTGLTSSNSQFTASPTNFNLTAGASQTVTVAFMPTRVGWEQSTLTITHNAQGSPATVTANGIGRMTPPTGNLDNTKIAFDSNRDGNGEVYVMNADGTNLVNRTNHPGTDGCPSWSPDGTKVAFESDRDSGTFDIYLMNADGTNLINLTNIAGHDVQPVWSPDGTKIAFRSLRDGGQGEVYVMNANGTNPVNLTHNGAEDSKPAWSPDGTKIAFASFREGNGEIYVMNADGSNPTRLTNHPAVDVTPAWSPDGTQIAFTSNRDGNYEVYVMNADGTNQTRLTNQAGENIDIDLSWSPDGTKIAFVLWRGGNGEIYVMNANGSNLIKLTDNPAADRHPSWSPFLQPPLPPVVSSLNPTYGSVGTSVTIIGEHFGASQNGSTVTFSGVQATSITSWSDIQIVAVVPVNATKGPVVVTVNGRAGNSDKVFTPNTPPVANPQSVTTAEDTALSITLTGSDADKDPLTFTVMMQPANGTLTGTAPNLTYTPNLNFNGSDSFTFKANDGKADSESATVSITVTQINDPPVFDAITNQTVLEDASATTLTVTGIGPGGGADESSQTVALTVAGSNPAIVPDPTFSGSGATRTLTFQPVANANGTATITMTVTDNGPTGAPHVNTFSREFTLTVTPVNDAPSFTKGANQTVLEDVGAQTVKNWATAMKPGPDDEKVQVLTFTVTSSNAALFSTQPLIDPTTGDLTYTPVKDANGTATVSVVLKDNGGTANGGKESSATETFTITMTPVNDAPVFDAIVNQTVLEDVAATPIQMTGIGPGGGADEASQTVALTVASSDPTIVPDPTLSGSGATRTLTFQPVANANGVVTITVTAKDNGGTANGGQDTFSRTFTVTVTSVNDPPTFDPIADQKVFEDAGATSIPINNIGPGGGSDELGQLVTLTATSSDPSIVPNPTIVGSGATRTLTFTPVAREGAVTITVKATDNGPASTPHVNTFERKFTITVAQGPVLSIAAPTANQILPAGTTSTTLAVNIQNHTGAWHWKLNDPFPTSGPAGGNRYSLCDTCGWKWEHLEPAWIEKRHLLSCRIPSNALHHHADSKSNPSRRDDFDDVDGGHPKPHRRVALEVERPLPDERACGGQSGRIGEYRHPHGFTEWEDLYRLCDARRCQWQYVESSCYSWWQSITKHFDQS
ncbi:PD40 domain-containing protein [Candidatus Poribacteria bacterium]|nr:PD40 domain-containing protein [Candidatus Poribacteria bacterium]